MIQVLPAGTWKLLLGYLPSLPKRQSIIEKIENIETKITPITTVGFSKPEKKH